MKNELENTLKREQQQPSERRRKTIAHFENAFVLLLQTYFIYVETEKRKMHRDRDENKKEKNLRVKEKNKIENKNEKKLCKEKQKVSKKIGK